MKRVSWNLAKIGGWNRYNVLTDECSEALDKVISDKTKTIEEVAEKVEKIHEKVKFKSFDKVTLSEKRQKKCCEKGDEGTEEEKAKELLDKQIKYAEEEIKKIEEKQKGHVGRIYEIKKKVTGIKKQAMLPTSVVNPKTGKLAVTKKN